MSDLFMFASTNANTMALNLNTVMIFISMFVMVWCQRSR